MKKLLFVAICAFSNLIYANERDRDSKESKKESKKETAKDSKGRSGDMYCQSYTMYVWCDESKSVNDTMCYDRDSPTDKRNAFLCMGRNSRLYNEFVCGSSDYGG